MNPITGGVIVFVCVFGGALLGMVLHKVLPEAHLQSNSTDVVKLATGLVVTMTGLVLGMLVSSGLTFYNLQKTELMQVCAKAILVDRVLGEYGPETQNARIELRGAIVVTMHHIWPDDKSQQADLKPLKNFSKMYQEVEALTPKDDQQRAHKAEALSLATQLYETHWLMFIGLQGNSISGPLLSIVVCWLTIIFLSFGLLAQRNVTVIVTLIVAALAVSAAIFIIREMYDPFGGVFRLTPGPVLNVLSEIGQ
jgi:hypothetical protein